MSRVLLVGPAPGTPPGFAHQRLALFRDALRTDGHEVTVLAAEGGAAARAAAGLDPADPTRHPHELVVSAGPYTPVAEALAVAGERPLWLDLPGDPWADALAARQAGAAPDLADAHALFGAALRRGDHYSTISRAAESALLGQLLLLGRLDGLPWGPPPTAVVPNAWVGPEEPPRTRTPGEPLRVLLFGSMNTWFDDETALAGLLRAMDHAPLEVHVTGGAVAGHHEAGFTRFVAGARASGHAARFHLHGWLAEGAPGGSPLDEVVGRCHVLLTLDRPTLEARFGSRSRVVEALRRGLRVLATPGPEHLDALFAQGFALPVPEGDAGALAARLKALSEALPPLPDRAPLRAALDPARLTAPLRAWARAPRRLPPAPGADAAALTLRAENRALRAELAALRGSPTFRWLDRPVRWIRRHRPPPA